MSYLMSPIHRILPHYEYKKIKENDKVTSPWLSRRKIAIKMVLQVALGYSYLWAMRMFQVNNIVTATLIYPIVLINYASMEVIVALFRDANSDTDSDDANPDPDADAHPIHIKFMLMMLSAQILLLSLVVWDDLYIIKPVPYAALEP